MCCGLATYKNARGHGQTHLCFLDCGTGTKWLFSRCAMHTRHFGLHEFPSFLNYPNTDIVLCAPQLILMERMLLAVFLAAPLSGNNLQRSIAGGRGMWASQWLLASPSSALYVLCRQSSLNTSLSFIKGRHVRQCHCRRHFSHTGRNVKTFLQMQWLIFRGVYGHRGREQYLDPSSLAMLSW